MMRNDIAKVKADGIVNEVNSNVDVGVVASGLQIVK